MSTFFIFFLTSILLGICAFTVLLILMQRPSEESGMGATLGGGAATSVFGGEAVNVLAKITKYCTIIFFILSFILSLLHLALEKADRPKNLLEKRAIVADERGAAVVTAAVSEKEGIVASEELAAVAKADGAVENPQARADDGVAGSAQAEVSKASEITEKVSEKEGIVASGELATVAKADGAVENSRPRKFPLWRENKLDKF
ncbi:MAG: preprotein translocase subunit SecG [Puniceicoccales bacterium]|jgi:preprotein translocase subunit SecG|nr:preprotein translocase subunit SecG [Puniceicoccales bacterium]